ncbi:MAG: hypothetical protein AB7O97_24345 [Planctomycetota bacterium]
MTRSALLLAAMAAIFLSVSFLAGCASAGSAAAKGGAMLYVCTCGDGCTQCDAVSLAPGKCGCGKERAAHHLIELDGSTAKVCSCGGDCSCSVSADPAMCSCGKPIRSVSLAGKGFYTCACDGSCGCSEVVAGPGKCGCGKDLIPIR